MNGVYLNMIYTTCICCIPYVGTEPYPELLTVISSLSAGPVGPGDMANGTDDQLLMRYTYIHIQHAPH